MPFILENLVPIGGQERRAAPGTSELAGRGAVCVWVYRTEDATTVVDAAGYFNGARGHLRSGDVILRVTVNGSGVVQNAGFHVVNDAPVSGGNVDVTDTLALTMTDSR